jgi:replication-associated recombination protein RarA
LAQLVYSFKKGYLQMNTIYKYRPKSIDEFVFADEQLEKQIRRYSEGRSVLPLILHGSNGTGKSLLGELIPKAIDGEAVNVTKIHAEDLNSKREVRDKFSRDLHFDRLFSQNGQRMGYTVVEEVNFDPTARDALRTCLDDMAERELFIFTTNELRKIDVGLRSRCEQIEVKPAAPDRFLQRAQHILRSEGVELDDAVVLEVLEAVFDSDCDNRKYYSALDEIIEACRNTKTEQGVV